MTNKDFDAMVEEAAKMAYVPKEVSFKDYLRAAFSPLRDECERMRRENEAIVGVTNAEMVDILERWDQTDAVMQRKILMAFATQLYTARTGKTRESLAAEASRKETK